MTPFALDYKLRTIVGELEALDKSAMRNWPEVIRYLSESASEIREHVEPFPMPYSAFLDHAAIVLEGSAQAMQLTFNSSDEAEQANVLAVIGTAVAGLMRTVKTCFIFDEGPAHD